MSKSIIKLTQTRKSGLYVAFVAIMTNIVLVLAFVIQPLLSQSTSYGYMSPVRSRVITEIDRPLCRWVHVNGITNYRSYKWGSNLQTPNSLWRNAFEASIADWNATAINVRYYYPGSFGSVILDTYNLQDGFAGFTNRACDPNNPTLTIGSTARGNVYYDILHNYSVNERRLVSGHELGHGIGIGHIPGRDFISIMGYYSNANTYYVPQNADIGLVNQVYP